MGLSLRDVEGDPGGGARMWRWSRPRRKIDAYKVIGASYKAEAKVWGVTHRYPELVKRGARGGAASRRARRWTATPRWR